MRNLLLITLLFGPGIVVSSPARAERICGEPECRTVECWPIPGGRRCRRECRRRCWNIHPRYEPPQEPDPVRQHLHPTPRYVSPDLPELVLPTPKYEPPRYNAPPSQVALPQLNPAALIVVGTVSFIVIVMLLTRGSRLRRELQRTENVSMSARALTRRLRADLDEADRVIAEHLKAAYRRGRNLE